MSTTNELRKRSSVTSLTSTDSILSDSSSFLDPLPPRLYSNDNDIFPSLYEDTDEFRRRCDSVDNFISAQSPGALFSNFPVEEIDFFTLEQRSRSQSLNTAHSFKSIQHSIPSEDDDIPTQLPDFGIIDEGIRYRSQSFSISSNYYNTPQLVKSSLQPQPQQLQQQQTILPFTSLSNHLQIPTSSPLIQPSTMTSPLPPPSINTATLPSLPSLSSITSSSSSSSSSITNQCKYYINGECKKGERCSFSHSTITSRSMSHDSSYSIESCSTNSRRTTRSFSLELPLSSHENFNELIKDQNGCRYLQKKIDEDSVINSEIIYENIKTKINEILCDQFGNYLFQKLYESLKLEYRIAILESIKNNIYDLCLHPYGTRGIQKIITVDYNCNEIVELLLSIILNNLDVISTDANGNHIIQISLKYFCNKYKTILIDEILSINHLIYISKAKHGSSVIQLSFIYCNEEQHITFINNIINNILTLIKDQYGNYIIQYILEHGSIYDKKQIIIQLSGKYYELSRNKVSSNVIEKCIRFCFSSEDNNDIFNMIIDELVSNINFHKLLTDAYANYVIQSALCSENQFILDKLHEAILPYMKEMKRTSGGRKILSKINKLYKKNT